MPVLVAEAQRRALAMQPVLRRSAGIATDNGVKLGLQPATDCAPLKPGHIRRIFFGNPTVDTFGLGSVELDDKGNEVGTRTPLASFKPSTPTICLPLRAGNQPAEEVWELVNLTLEDHNFHLHQTRFALVAADASIPGSIDGAAVCTITCPCQAERPGLRRHVRRRAAERNLGVRHASGARAHPVQQDRGLRLSLPHPRARGWRHDGRDQRRGSAVSAGERRTVESSK